jgi:hypothetical protein
MSEIGVVGGIIAGACTISLYLVKKLTQCICPGRMAIEYHSGNPSQECIPVVTLEKLWEEIIDVNGQQLIGGDVNRYAKQDGNIWDVNINDKNAFAHIYREVFQKPKSGNHYFRIKLKNITDNHVFIFIKRFKGPPNEWKFSEDEEGIFKQRAVEGLNYIYKPSLIGEGDVTKEQIGITFESRSLINPISGIIEEAYYSDKKINIFSCCRNTKHLYYRCYNDSNLNEI